jgi:MarR family transcriptional regulator, temperature-dependent positive regulator of motility
MQRKAQSRLPTNSPVVQRFAALSTAFMDRFLSMLRSVSPDPRLSYPRYRVLSWVDASTEVSVGQIATNLGIARSTASEMVARMERDGLVNKRADEGDARSVVIALTPLGQRLVKRRRKELSDAQRTLLSRMSPEDQQAFIQAFETVDRLARKALPS